MGAQELLALSLGLSILAAALAWAGGRLVERSSADPRLRDRMWGLALVLPALPPLVVGLILLTPAPVREVVLSLPVSPLTDVQPLIAAAPDAHAPRFVFDPAIAALAVIVAAGLLTLTRLVILALRARRLNRMIQGAEAPDASVAEQVKTAAGRLAIRAPLVGVSNATPEPLLAGLGRPRLILPVGLTTTMDPAVVDAILTHEMAHLKRGDHRALWLEEALLALLAVNPLMPLLRARRAAAREEACDALALAGVGPETRRAYAQSLIEALRTRAGPPAAGALPVLTFTGAGRTTAMLRLKTVLNPAAPAGRRSRLLALGVGALTLAAAGASSLAVAAQREPDLRTILTAASDPAIETEAVASPAGVPQRIEIGPGGGANLVLTHQDDTTGAQTKARLLLNGAPMPEGLPIWAVSADRANIRMVEPRELNLIVPLTGETPVSVNGRLMPEGFPADGIRSEAVARVETVGDHVFYTLKSEAEALETRESSAPSQSPAPGSQARANEVVAWMPVAIDGRVILGQGDLIYVALADADGAVLAQSSVSNPAEGLRVPLVAAQFPRLGQAARAYTLTGEIRRADGSVERAVEPVTVRLSPGSQRTARALRPSLTFSATAPARAQTSSLRFNVGAALPIQVRDGDVLNVWIDGPFERGARTTRTLSTPLAPGAFRPISTQVDVAAPSGRSDFVYRAEIVDRNGRKTHETHAPALLTVRGPSAVATPSLLPVR